MRAVSWPSTSERSRRNTLCSPDSRAGVQKCHSQSTCIRPENDGGIYRFLERIMIYSVLPGKCTADAIAWPFNATMKRTQPGNSLESAKNILQC